MPVLNESSRRNLTLLIFLILGPFFLSFIVYTLFARNLPGSIKTEEKKISSIIGYNVNFSQRDFLRPGAQRLSNVIFSSRSSSCEILFCPEIYFIKEDNPDFIKKIASNIDSNALSKIEGKFDEINLSCDNKPHSQERISNVPYRRIVKTPKKSLISLLFSPIDSVVKDSSTNKINDCYDRAFNDYLLIIIPTAFCKKSQILDIKNDFYNLFHQITNNIGNSSNPTLLCCFAIGELRLLNDQEYEFIQEDVCDQPRKNNRELAAFFNEKKTTSKHGLSVPITKANTQLDVETMIRSFEIASPILEKCVALYIDQKDQKRVDVIFELKNISNCSPYYFCFESFPQQSTKRLEFNSQSAPTPTSFAELFIPFFKAFGPTCWFSGKIEVESFSSENVFFTACNNNTETQVKQSSEETLNQSSIIPYWNARLNDFHLCNCKLDVLSKHIKLPNFTGNITDLTVLSGIINQGVFEGSGKLEIKNGTIPKSVLKNFSDNKYWEIIPSQTLNYHFINDEIPFNEFELSFNTTKTGITFDSNYRNKIIACYENGSTQYGIFLSEVNTGNMIPYFQILKALTNSETDTFWSPLFKNAINHLPMANATQK